MYMSPYLKNVGCLSGVMSKFAKQILSSPENPILVQYLVELEGSPTWMTGPCDVEPTSEREIIACPPEPFAHTKNLLRTSFQIVLTSLNKHLESDPYDLVCNIVRTSLAFSCSSG